MNIHPRLILGATLALPMIALAMNDAGMTPRCTDTVGAPVVNAEVRVINDADSGIAGNYWALDTLERHITVWKTSTPGSFCATVRDEGSFTAFAGQRSPGNTGTLTGDEHGQIKGGYVAKITGSLSATPAWKTKGDIGTIDYQCTESGDCPGYVSWMAQYFAAGYTYDLPAWGWAYRGGRYGTWVNAAAGNTGDILPAPHVSDD